MVPVRNPSFEPEARTGEVRRTATSPGLKPGSTVHFRYRAVTKGGGGDWSKTVSLIVD
jgi:hypothetical protein